MGRYVFTVVQLSESNRKGKISRWRAEAKKKKDRERKMRGKRRKKEATVNLDRNLQLLTLWPHCPSCPLVHILKLYRSAQLADALAIPLLMMVIALDFTLSLLCSIVIYALPFFFPIMSPHKPSSSSPSYLL